MDPIQNAHIREAAAAGVELIGRETTLIPGSMAQKIMGTWALLAAIRDGQLIVSNPAQAVNSEHDSPISEDSVNAEGNKV